MRLGLTLPAGGETKAAITAEARGVAFVHVVAAPGTEAAVAATVVAVTSAVRVLVGLGIGDENPVTLAEDVAVLDNLSNGRVAVLANLGGLSADAAVEDLTLLRASWSGRPVRHTGERWRIPARLPGHRAPDAVHVTPLPAQLAVPLWVTGSAAAAVGTTLGLPVLAGRRGDIDATAPVAPGRAELSGSLDADRDEVSGWADAGATHLVCAGDIDLDDLARWLIPEVAMVAFPRVVADSPLPRPWPRAAG